MCLYIIVYQRRYSCNIPVPGKGERAIELQVPNENTEGLTGCCLQRLFPGIFQISDAERDMKQ